MNIIAIDLSMTSTGVALFVKNKLEKVFVLAERKAKANETNLIELKYRPPEPEGEKKKGKKRKAVVDAQDEVRNRLMPLSSAILRLIETVEEEYVIDKIVFEGLSFRSKGDRIFNIGKLTGIVQADLSMLSREFEVVPPKTVKKAVTGNGNAPKNVVAIKVFKLYDIDLSVYGKQAEDMYDAIAIGHAYLKQVGEIK